MFTIRRTVEFDAWFSAIRDSKTKQRLVARLRKAQLGNLGDVKALGAGVFEMREHFGPGWRMYCLKRGPVLIVMLAAAINPRRPPILERPCSLRPESRIE